MTKTTGSEGVGILVLLILAALIAIFASQSDTRGVLVDHIKYGDAKANEMHNSVGTCKTCKKKNQKLTDGECPPCFFGR